ILGGKRFRAVRSEQLGGEFGRGAIPEAAVRSAGVVLLPPALDRDARIIERRKPVFVQALIAQHRAAALKSQSRARRPTRNPRRSPGSSAYSHPRSSGRERRGPCRACPAQNPSTSAPAADAASAGRRAVAPPASAVAAARAARRSDTHAAPVSDSPASLPG